MARLQSSSRSGVAGASVLKKGLLAGIAALAFMLAFAFALLPGQSAKAYADGEEQVPDIVVAPLVNHGVDADHDDNRDMTPSGGYSVTVTPVADKANFYTVDFTAKGLKQHYNGNHKLSGWIGIGIPAAEGNEYQYGEYTDEFAMPTTFDKNPISHFEKNGKGYDSFYIGLDTPEDYSFQWYVAVKNNDTTTVYIWSFAHNVVLARPIAISQTENGTITINDAVVADAPEAAEGEKVVMTVTPDEGYLIDDDENGDKVSVTYNDGTKDVNVELTPLMGAAGEDEVDVQAVQGSYARSYEFTMPAYPVTATAEFRAQADLTALTAAIESAKATQEEAVVSEQEGADVLVDQKWVTKDVADALDAAIDEGEQLGETAKQADVDKATQAIKEAEEAFKAAEKDGTKGYKAAFDEELATAAKLLEETAVSTDGTDVKKTQKWVTEEQAKDLSDAVEAAEENKAKAEAGTISYKDAYTPLKAAVDTFEEAMQDGKAEAVDPTELEAAIDEATDLVEGAVIAEDPAEVPEGETFYEKTAVDDLKTAITRAQAIADLEDATQAQLDKATENLNKAIDAFKASAQKGTKKDDPPTPEKTDLSKATIAKIDDQLYTGKAIEPKLAVTLDKKELVAGTDFTVAYEDNTEVGEATATITGAGAYKGGAKATFAITSPAKAAMATMPDLDAKAWYMGGDGTRGGYFPGTDTLYLDYALARGLMSGYVRNGKVVGFGPNDPLSRAQVATVLYRMANDDITPTTVPAKYEKNKTGLPDVEDGKYYTAAVNWAFENGVMTGYTDASGKAVAFGPNDPTTREQIATTVGRWCMSDAGGKMPKPAKGAADLYDDADQISGWALEGVAFCNENGIMTGVGGSKNFDPKSNTQRCQMAKIIAVTDKIGNAQAEADKDKAADDKAADDKAKADDKAASDDKKADEKSAK